MSKADIGPRIGIEGEAEFKKQIRQIDAEYKTLRTEVARVTSEFIGNENSIEALTAVTDALGAEEVKLEKKQELLRVQLQRTADAYGVADEKTQKLTQEYNKNEVQLNKLRAQIRDNESEIKQLTKAQEENGESGQQSAGIMQQLGFSLNGLGSKLGLSTEQTKALSSMFSGGGMSLAVAGAAAAAGIMLVVEAVKKTIQFMAQAVDESRAFADEILTLAQQSGFSTEFLQGVHYAAEQVDVSAEAIIGSMRKLKKNLFSDSEDVRNAWATLNIIPEQLIANQTPMEDIFRLVVQGLSNIDNELVRDNIAMTLFGKSADELAGVIDDGGEKLYGLINQAKDFGYVLTNEQLAALGAVDDAYAEWNQEMANIKRQIATELAPALLELIPQLIEIARTVDWEAFGKAAAGAIRDIAPLLIDLADSIANVANAFASLFEMLDKLRNWGSNSGNGGSFGKAIGATAGRMLRKIPGVGNLIQIADVVGMGADVVNAVSARDQTIQVDVQIDSQTVARSTYSATQAENARVGTHAIH